MRFAAASRAVRHDGRIEAAADTRREILDGAGVHIVVACCRVVRNIKCVPLLLGAVLHLWPAAQRVYMCVCVISKLRAGRQVGRWAGAVCSCCIKPATNQCEIIAGITACTIRSVPDPGTLWLHLGPEPPPLCLP